MRNRTEYCFGGQVKADISDPRNAVAAGWPGPGTVFLEANRASKLLPDRATSSPSSGSHQSAR
jgi:hypothetical protein